MYIYIVCSVRNSNPDNYARSLAHVFKLEREGHRVHYPKRDVDQSDPTGTRICATHYSAMQSCDEVHVIWDPTSYGSHFDIGMAYALQKPLRLIYCPEYDPTKKSYEHVMEAWPWNENKR